MVSSDEHPNRLGIGTTSLVQIYLYWGPGGIHITMHVVSTNLLHYTAAIVELWVSHTSN